MQVKYAGVNPVDTYKRSGAYANLPTLPFTPGNDGAGLVAKVGNEVTKVKVYYSLVFLLHEYPSSHLLIHLFIQY